MIKNLTIRSRLILILAVLVVFLLGIEMLGLFGMSNAIEGLRTVYHDRAIPLKQVAEIESLLLRNRIAVTAALMMPTPETIRTKTAVVDQDLAKMTQVWQAYISSHHGAEEKALATQFAEDRDRFITEGIKPAVIALRKNEIGEAYRILIEKVRPLYTPVDASIKALLKLQLDGISQEYDREQSRYETIRNILVASIGIALVLAALISVVLSDAIFRPLENVVKIARGVAVGDFMQEIEVRSKDEIGQLMQALKEMRDSLVDTIGQIRDSEAHTRALLSNLIDGVASIDEQGVIKTFNPAAERIFGYAGNEIIGRDVNLLFPKPQPEQDEYADDFRQYLEAGKPKALGVPSEVTGLRKSGTVFPMDLAVVEMHGGEHRMFVAIVRDISKRKLEEEQKARLMDELESANEELRNFAHVVSHDLKAPLRAIGALADWLSTDYADKFDDEGKEHMRLLVSRVHRMSNLIDGILQYSRVGRVREALVELDLEQVVHEVIDLLSPPANIAIRIENPLPRIIAEPTRIQQIFQNLLSNAIKYMDKPRGDIRIACSIEGERWKFGIIDNGPGIEARHFERIFQLFQTLAPRDRIESTGVGLALVKKIVEMYSGEIWIESKAGIGSTFFFTLPKIAANIDPKSGR
ncbi:Tar ligand binding domain-containing protein [Nitrosospira sp. NpAV]|uniref:Tar ligand binding domain-containing protein n=1 Tax=Nitrosospira sp. NpAV TaxID=58133 RepID=UPI0005A1F9F1|nr:Tar ligand binding domain-containing protein [Nitrosospira sp. NpAV]KIO49127.1 histidine kinase [Nitrosospira sp. NpAV]